TFEHLSCDRLQHIDQLWRTYSQDQFGFSVQKNLVAQNGDDPTNLTVKAYRRLALQTGWKTGTDQEGSGYRRYRSLDFSDAAPQGQFPASPWGGYNYRREFGPFLGSNQELGQRIARCL
ncbi:MAG: GUN4 domain-containing protein, partial [Prochlorotrichaceae cyanobacterium]